MRRKEKGITLIALVITIIVMLILVAVTLNVALQGGLFANARKAVTDTQTERDKELASSSGRIKVDGKWYDSLEDYTKGIESSDQNDGPSKWAEDTEGNIKYEGKDSGIKIGDYVNYKPVPETTTYESSKLGKNYTGSSSNGSDGLTTDKTLNWRVLGVDAKGCLTLISDKPTTKDVYFEGAKGYNNGVYILNDICKTLYSNTELGVTARSITIEDIEAGFSPTGETERDNYNKDSDSNTQYGKTNETPYSSNKTYPVIYKAENGSGIDTTSVKTDGIGVSDPYYSEDTLPIGDEQTDTATADSRLTCKQTYYLLETSDTTKYCKNDKFYEMIFKTNTYYWLASRDVSCSSSYAFFALRVVRSARLDSSSLFCSDGYNTYGSDNYLRPVVSLGSNISIEKVDNNSDTNPHKIPGLE